MTTEPTEPTQPITRIPDDDDVEPGTEPQPESDTGDQDDGVDDDDQTRPGGE
jgi:hypothetical protein